MMVHASQKSALLGLLLLVTSLLSLSSVSYAFVWSTIVIAPPPSPSTAGLDEDVSCPSCKDLGCCCCPSCSSPSSYIGDGGTDEFGVVFSPSFCVDSGGGGTAIDPTTFNVDDDVELLSLLVILRLDDDPGEKIRNKLLPRRRRPFVMVDMAAVASSSAPAGSLWPFV